MSSKEPFRCELKADGNVLEIHPSGYCDGDASEAYLRDVNQSVERMRRASGAQLIGLLYFEALAGFEAGRAARIHGQWFAKMAPNLFRIAVVSQKASISLSISIAQLMVRTPLKQFPNERAARGWLQQG